MICLWMGKTYKAKTPSGDFKVTTLKNLLLSQQAVTSKEISVPYTNLQLNHYPNTQLDLFCSDNLSFQCTAPNMWLNNRCTDPSTRLNYQLEKDVGYKVLQLQDEDHKAPWSQNPTVYKRSSFLNRKMN